MKILFVLEHYHPYIGGVEKLFTLLAEKLAERGNYVKVVTTKHEKKLASKETINGVDIVRLNLRNRFVFTFFSFLSTIKHAKGVDVIHTTSYNAAPPAYIAGLVRKKKTLITFHEYWGGLWFKLPFLGPISKTAFWLYEQIVVSLPFSKFISVSDFTDKALKKRKKKSDIVKIYNGIEYHGDTQHCPSGDTFSFTFFGRLGVSKGLDLLLEGAKLFFDKHPHSHLNLIIPKVPKTFFKRIVNIINEYGIKDNIRMYHNLSQIELASKLNESHCVVIPSYSEGFCYAAAESCSIGIPVISSGKGALPEVVSGKHIIMEEHSPKGLYLALQKAKNNEWKNKNLKKFELNHQLTNYLSLYDSLIKE